MKKRLKFQCWKCLRKYSLQREFSKDQKLYVACPYCKAEAVADLEPYKHKKVTIYSGQEEGESDLGYELVLPEILPTQAPE